MERKRKKKAIRISRGTWVGVIIGIVGIGLALFFGLRPQPERELVYAVNPVRATVVTAGQASELAVSYKGEPLGSVNVTAAQIAIWNAGKLSIWEDDILEPIVIYTDPPVPILEASIRQYSREVTKFTLDDTPESLASGRVPISWRILEENDGASIQLIYVGTEEVKLQVQGVIEGLPEIKCVELGVAIKTPQEQISEQQGVRWLALGMAVVFGAAFVWNGYSVLRGPRRRRDLVEIAVYLGVTGFCIWAFFWYSPRLWPPFGF